MPKFQPNHNYPDKAIMPWLDLHFPADSSYNGRIHIGYHKKDGDGIYDLSRRNIGELREFIPAMHISSNVDYYITANSMAGVRRTNDGVFALHNIVIDIDCHSEDMHNKAELAASLVWRLSRDLWTEGLAPEPNSIVYTGRGLQLWWAIEPISVKVKYWYRRLQSWLMDQIQSVLDEYPEGLSDLSIDSAASTKLCGWFRLPLSFNTKAGRWGSLQINRNTRYSLQELLDEYVPAEYNPNRKKPSQGLTEPSEAASEYIPLADRDAEVLRGGTSAMAMRVYQMIRLRALRNAPKGEEKRDLLNLIVYCALLADLDQQEAFARTLAFNDGFKDPMPRAELEKALSTATEKQYKFPNDWIIDTLRLSEDEQNAIGLRPATEKKERRKSNYTRDTIRKATREDRDNKILAMFSEGISRAEIARTMGLSRNTVAKVINADTSAQEAAYEAEMDNAVDAMMEVAAGAENQGSSLLKNGSNNYVSYPKNPCSLSPAGGQAPIYTFDPSPGGNRDSS